MFVVEWTRRASLSLERLERDIIIRIIRKVESAKENPYFYLKRLVKEKVWKLRIGDYRVLLDIDAEKEILYVLEVGHRKKIYKK